MLYFDDCGQVLDVPQIAVGMERTVEMERGMGMSWGGGAARRLDRNGRVFMTGCRIEGTWSGDAGASYGTLCPTRGRSKSAINHRAVHRLSGVILGNSPPDGVFRGMRGARLGPFLARETYS